MDGLKWDGAAAAMKKYGIGLAVLLLGLLLMALPREEEAAAVPAPVAQQQSLEESLGKLLSRLEGAGKVEVLLTQAVGAETIYQTDEDTTEGETARDQRVETVIVTGADRAQTGLVRQINPPRYLGAVVLCQGGADARVRLQIVEAVMSVTGLRSDRITVLKMK